MFWRSTVEEVQEILKAVVQAERRANLRAGLIAATVANTNPFRRRGARLLQPSDFVSDGRREYMSPEEGAAFMNRWAKRMNRKSEESA